MRKYSMLLLLVALHLSLYSQPNRNADRISVIQLEEKIIDENTDQEAIRLIKVNNEKTKALNDFRLSVINSYENNLSQQEKNIRFRKEFINSKELRELKDEEKIASDIKIAYLKSAYPNTAFYSKVKRKLSNRGLSSKFKKKG